MKKQHFTQLFFLPFLLLLCLGLKAQKNVKPSTVTSVIAELKIAKYKTGLNEVKKLDNGYKVFVNLVNNKLPEFIIKDSKGNDVPSVLAKPTSVTCWRCFKDTKTGERHCVEITCPNPGTMVPWDAIKAKDNLLPVLSQ